VVGKREEHRRHAGLAGHLPRLRRRELSLARLAPSVRSLLVGLAIVAAAAGLYIAARQTSVFAVRTIEVHGASPRISAQVEEALEPLVGRSLLRVDGTDVRRRLAPLASVATASYDRAFPHTLRVYVTAEQPLAVLRQGSDGWLVSVRGRVVRELAHPRLSSLPRVWLPRSVSIVPGAELGDALSLQAVRALAPVRGSAFLRRVRDVRTSEDELTLILRSGLELRLGDASDVLLKLAVARTILPRLSPPGYLDVSVPERPVSSTNPQVEG
jgi:cell division protein FtsQ